MPEDTYRSVIERIARQKSSTVTVFGDFCRMVACFLSAGMRNKEFAKILKRYSEEEIKELDKALELLTDEMESKPFTDVLGPYYLDIASHSSKQARGEFYTPQEISKLMAKMTINSDTIIEKGLPVSISEPACGAGGIVLAVAEEFAPEAVDLMRVTCHDINPVAVDMCYINTTMWGIPARIIQGNNLSNTPSEYAVHSWTNIHWHRVGEDQRLAMKRMIEFLKEPPVDEKQPVNEPEATKPILGDQVLFDFDLGDSSVRQR